MKIKSCWASVLVVVGLSWVGGCGTELPESKSVENSADSSPGASSTNEETQTGNTTQTDFPVDLERFLDELEPGDWEAICTWMVEIQGGPHTLQCDEGVSITIDTVEECAERSEFPHCQVGLLVACVSAQAEDLCGDAPAACDDFYACVYGTR